MLTVITTLAITFILTASILIIVALTLMESIVERKLRKKYGNETYDKTFPKQ